MSDTRPLLLLLLLTEHKTERHGRTNRPQNRTEKAPNVTSETLLELKTWGT